MNRPSRPRVPAKVLNDVLAAYQAASVIPHCTSCLEPCCRLEKLVLELEWKQVKQFWRLDESRPAFDKKLARGEGPQEIRAGNGLYYIHRKPCPAYDQVQHNCSVYGQDIKPAGCSDFPVYADEGYVTADLRCEAVNLDELKAAIAAAVGPEFRVSHAADEEFPFLISLSLKPAGGKRK